MKAFVIGTYTSGLLMAAEIEPPPAPARGEVQLRLLGTSINPVDQLIARGYGAPLFNPRRRFPLVPGRDALARVLAVGPGIGDLHPGQRVLVAASPRTGGTYARVFNLPRRCLAPIDSRLSDAAAASLGYAGLTALQALAKAGISAGTAPGRRLCINGASGGVGSIALLLASRWGAEVTAVASQKNHAWLQALAPCTVVDYRDAAAMADISADVVLNCATPAAGERAGTDPLLHALRQGRARQRTYVTTITPLLGNVTQDGVLPGLAASGIDFLKRSLMLRREGIAYHWLMFRENPGQLAQLAEFFAQHDSPEVIGARFELDDLPAQFNGTDEKRTPGKSIFLSSRLQA